MRRHKKPKVTPTQYNHGILVIVAVVLKLVEVSALFFIVQKNQCNNKTDDSGHIFRDENIQQQYIHAYYTITDLCSATDNVCELCPLNWDAYNGKCYLFSEERINWSQSEKECQRRKAELISIENLKEQDFILRHVSLKNGHFWIGLTKNGSHWYWKTGGKFQGNMSITSAEHQCATYGKDLSAESCYNPNKWICKKKMSRF
ncbi:CD209 antigen-like protein C isoform X2 [Hyla sarda]|uniref:CD209 antigen-like protein C isoform X2 n=1 Tax=Hyla sarda TaxID=327740 RepID=UPI0024C23722|nr:CD209 antigen-like protein C isoform X2 [Hyla sarda]